MSQAEHMFRMAALEAKEKDLRTIVIDGFKKTDDNFAWVRDGFARMDNKFAEIDQKLDAHEEQIDTLAMYLQETRFSFEKRMNKMDGKLDRILQALAIS